ncbi:MAG: hypothetical protein ACRELF_10395 [Gemmataceae bacterium]
MSRVHDLAFRLLAVLLLLVPFGSDVAGIARTDDKNGEEPVRDFAKLERGMTPEQVRKRVGAPTRVARQILYHRYREQWIYDAPIQVRLTFDCPRGQKPQLLSVPRLSVEKNLSDRRP